MSRHTRELSRYVLNRSPVVPSRMNPVGEAGNMFSALFDQVPAKRPGQAEDIAGAIIYLVSRAGVNFTEAVRRHSTDTHGRHTSMEYLCASMAGVSWWPMAKSEDGRKRM